MGVLLIKALKKAPNKSTPRKESLGCFTHDLDNKEINIFIENKKNITPFELIKNYFTTHKIEKFPIILVGTKFWSGLLIWIKETVLNETNNISEKDLKLIHVVDTKEEVI